MHVLFTCYNVKSMCMCCSRAMMSILCACAVHVLFMRYDVIVSIPLIAIWGVVNLLLYLLFLLRSKFLSRMQLLGNFTELSLLIFLQNSTILAKIMWRTVSFLRTGSHLPGADLRFNKSPHLTPLLNVVECNLLLTLPATSFRDIQH